MENPAMAKEREEGVQLPPELEPEPEGVRHRLLSHLRGLSTKWRTLLTIIWLSRETSVS
jgi:hypothetical protein